MIKYRAGYKYQLDQPYQVIVNINPVRNIDTEFIKLSKSGVLSIKAGYAWDGASSIAIDTKSFMRGSLVHDALYQLIRQEHLKMSHREQADKELYRICLEDGMNRVRAWGAWKAVSLFGKPSAHPDDKRKIYTAP